MEDGNKKLNLYNALKSAQRNTYSQEQEHPQYDQEDGRVGGMIGFVQILISLPLFFS
jgi:hypothetical protein